MAVLDCHPEDIQGLSEFLEDDVKFLEDAIEVLQDGISILEDVVEVLMDIAEVRRGRGAGDVKVGWCGWVVRGPQGHCTGCRGP